MPEFDKVLVLDLDETLIHATDAPLEHPHDFTVGPYFVYRRPGVDIFLQECLQAFEVGVWTSSTGDYATGIVSELLDPGHLSFVWDRSRCTSRFDSKMQEYTWVKNIQKLARRGYSKEKIVFVDDSAEKIDRSYGNLVRVRAFEGDPGDDELPALAIYLRTLGPVANVRTVEKRGWRTREGTSNKS